MRSDHKIKFKIVSMVKKDWLQIADIYHQGIESGNATFEQKVPEWTEWDRSHLKSPRLVSRSGDTIIGWAALSAISDRCVYGGVAEVSVYVYNAYSGLGIGTSLLENLITESERRGIWTLQAGIFPENTASIRIHVKCGFRQVGIRQKLGKMKGIWRDVLLLERRSTQTGID